MRAIFDNGHIDNVSPAYKSVFIPMFCVFVSYYLITYFIFLYRATVSHDQALIQRSVLLLSCHTFCAVVYTCNGLLHGAVKNYPCYIDVWLSFFSYVLWIHIFILYMLRFYVLVRSHELILRQARINPVTPDNLINHLAQLRQAADQVFWNGTRQHSRSRSERQRRSSNGRESTLSLIMGRTMLKPSRRSSETSQVKTRHVPWTKRVMSVRLYGAVICIAVLGIVGVLAIMTSLMDRLSLKHTHYNCFGGFEYLPQVIIMGIFNIIVGPAYTILIWRYRDAYGIQRAMLATFAIGVVAWAAALTWRLNTHWVNHHVSATVVYVFQFMFAHTYFAVIPVVKSIRFGQLQKRGHRDTQQMHEESFLDNVGTDGLAAAQTSKQSFLVAMQNAHKHQKLEQFAETCLCAELMSFLDVYLAFKSCIYHNVLSSATNLGPEHQPHQLPTASRITTVPSVVITEADQPGLALDTHLQTPHSANAGLGPNQDSHSAPEPANHHGSNRISRLLEYVNQALPVLSQSSSRTSQKSETTDARSVHPHVAADLVSLDTGIVETIEHAFPEYGASYATPVPEDLREKMTAIIETFILPSSPLEVNVGSRIIALSQEYVRGAPMACGLLDEAKDEVVDLLYSNVYIRYQQL